MQVKCELVMRSEDEGLAEKQSREGPWLVVHDLIRIQNWGTHCAVPHRSAHTFVERKPDSLFLAPRLELNHCNPFLIKPSV